MVLRESVVESGGVEVRKLWFRVCVCVCELEIIYSFFYILIYIYILIISTNVMYTLIFWYFKIYLQKSQKTYLHSQKEGVGGTILKRTNML
jgi:hypothetical protein